MLPTDPKYIGVSTLPGHVARAVDFQARTDVYMTIGCVTPWDDPSDADIDDNNPPIPSPLKLTLDEPVVAKRAALQLVVPDDSGEIEVFGQRWRGVTPQEAQAEGARWVLVSANFRYNEAPIARNDSFLSAAAAAGVGELVMKSIAGYQVGDQIQLGVNGELKTVDEVNVTDKKLVVEATLSALPKGTFITNLTSVDPFKYRQVGILSHATSLGLAGQELLPYEMLTGQALEYYYNTVPIPRQIGYRDIPRVILTF